jgi:hypothetical protein
MDFTGKLTFIGQLEQFDTRDGRQMISRDIVLTTDEQYPRSACITLRNELAQNFAHNIGATIRVSFDINARPNREGTRFFNQLTAWRIA